MQGAVPVVRNATDEDLQKIVDDYGASHSSPLNPFSTIEGLKRIPRQGLLIAEVEKAYAGFLYWFTANNPRMDSDIDKYACIAEIKVKKEFWNRSVGERLVAAALKEIDDLYVSAVYVDNPEMNPYLQSLYEKAGFTTFARTAHLRYIYPKERVRTKRPHDESRELAVYLVELREHCRMFTTAYSELQDIIDNGPPSDDEGKRIHSARIWFRLQAAMAACAVISKILWPQPVPRQDASDKRAILRGREIRQILKLPGQTPFPLAVRNAFEHVNEKLSDWLPAQEEDLPVGWSLSPFEPGEEPEDPNRAFRYFNIVTMELRVADARCNLSEVAEKVRGIERAIPKEAHVVFTPPKEKDV